MAESERPAGWTYSLMQVSQDKRASRVAVRKPYASELLGVDGLSEDGARPFPGFIQVHEFESGFGSVNHDTTSELLEAWPVDFVIGEDSYGYGFVYRVRRKNGATGATATDVFIDYYSSNLGIWTRGVVIIEGIPLPVALDPENGKQVSVTTWGQFVYVYVEGQVASSFRVRRDFPFLAGVVDNDTGPGKRPTLIEPSKAGALGSIVETGDADRPGAGQVVLLAFTPSETGLGIGGSGSGSGAPGQTDDAARLLDPGGYTFAYMLHNSNSGLRSSLSELATAKASDFDYDPDSGSGSGETVALKLYAAIEICYDTAEYDQAYIYRSVRVEGAGGTYFGAVLHLEAVISLEDFHTVNNPLAGDLAQSIYYYELPDLALAAQRDFQDAIEFDEDTPHGGCAFWYEGTMVVSNIRAQGSSSSEMVREKDSVRGLGELRWSSLVEVNPELFSPINRWTPPIPSNTVIAFELTGPNLFGFSRDRMYLVRKEGTYLQPYPMHDGYGIVSQFALDTVGSFIYFVTSKGLKTVDSAAQLEDVRSMNAVVLGPWKDSLDRVSVAYDPTAAALFVHNGELFETVVLWMNTARVTELRDSRFSITARGVWPDGFEYDQSDLRLFEGLNNETYLNPLIERAFFFDNSPKTTVSEAIPGFRHRVFVLDYKREKTQVMGSHDGEPRYSMMPFEGNSVFEVDITFAAGNTITLDVGGPIELGGDVYGLMLYVLECENPDKVGLGAVIKYRATTAQLVLGDGLAEFVSDGGLAAGTKVGISPVYFQWVAGPVGVQTMEDGGPMGEEEDFFRVKHFKSVGCSFTDVSGTGLDEGTVARFKGLAYRGSQEEPAAVSETLDREGETVVSIADGEGTTYAAFANPNSQLQGKSGVNGSVLSPGVRIICPDVDYRLIGVRVTGDVLATYRTQRAT